MVRPVAVQDGMTLRPARLLRKVQHDDARRRETRLRSAGDGGRDAAAVRLVADDQHRVAMALDRGAHVLRRRAGRKRFLRLRLPEAERLCRLARAQQRARQHGVRADSLRPEPFAEAPGLVATLGRQRPQFVRSPRRRIGVTDEHDPHDGGP